MRDKNYKGSTAPLDVKKNNNVWDCIDDFIAVLNEMRAGNWNWYLNTKCKYVGLRVDMRDGGCLIMDSDGNRIDPKDLAWQYRIEESAVLVLKQPTPGMGATPVSPAPTQTPPC